MTAAEMLAMAGPLPAGWEVEAFEVVDPDDAPAVGVHIPGHGTEYVYFVPGAWLASDAWWPSMTSDPPPEHDRHATLIDALRARWLNESLELAVRSRYLSALADALEATP
jgi:hypothetical protein